MASVLRTINPATGEPLGEVPEADEGEVGKALERSDRAFSTWSRRGFAERAEPMQRAAELLRKEKSAHAQRMAREMGKPVSEGEAEAEKCAWVCEYYAEHAERFLAPETIKSDASRSYVRFDPLGPVLAIMPWNFPYWSGSGRGRGWQGAGAVRTGLLRVESNGIRRAGGGDAAGRRAAPEGEGRARGARRCSASRPRH